MSRLRALWWALLASVTGTACSLLVDDARLSDGECPVTSCLGEDGRRRCVPEIAPAQGCVCEDRHKWCMVSLSWQCVPVDDPEYGCAQVSCAPCFFTNAKAICNAAGSCAFSSCLFDWADCDANQSCETHLTVDEEHCGSCEGNCLEAVRERAGADHHVTHTGCVDRRCIITRCEEGFTDCDGAFASGCEVTGVCE